MRPIIKGRLLQTDLHFTVLHLAQSCRPLQTDLHIISTVLHLVDLCHEFLAHCKRVNNAYRYAFIECISMYLYTFLCVILARARIRNTDIRIRNTDIIFFRGCIGSCVSVLGTYEEYKYTYTTDGGDWP